MATGLSSKLILAALQAWSQVLRLGPYVAGGILLAALLHRLDLPRRWGRWLSRRGPGAVLGAAFLGVLSPLCTYGTVPVLLELLHAGASPGPAIAFLAASSLLNPQLFVVMSGGLGLPLALTHLAGVLLLSAPVGLLAQRLRPQILLNEAVLPTPRTPAASPREHGGKEEGSGERGRGFLSHLLRLTEVVGLYFVVGVILAALLQVLVSAQFVASLLGADRWHGVVLAGVLGVPFYACGGGAVPLIATLLDQGMSPGAALAFFLAGPATRLTALAAMRTLLNRRALVAYVAYVVAGAVLAGTLLNVVFGA